MTFYTLATFDDLREGLTSLTGRLVPKFPTTIQAWVMQVGAEVKSTFVTEIQNMLSRGLKFSTVSDEWSSLANRRYMSITLRAPEKFKYGSNLLCLGLHRIEDRMDYERCNKIFRERCAMFGVQDINRDLTACATDACSVIVKAMTQNDAEHLCCMSHGLHLAVIEWLYEKFFPDNIEVLMENENLQEIMQENNSEKNDVAIDEDFEDEDSVYTVLKPQGITGASDYNVSIKGIADKVRAVCKIFKYSCVKNDKLQRIVKEREGREIKAQLDCKTRWNSLYLFIYNVQYVCKVA